MARDLDPNALGFIRLSYEQPLPDEHLRGVEDMIRQTGLEILNCRRYTEQPDNQIDHVVEIIANYNDIPLEIWSDLLESITKTYCWPYEMGTRGYHMRQTI